MQEPRRVEILIPPRTLLTVAAFGGLVVLTVVSIGTLLSILVAAVVALGLDPVVSALVQRGWGRGRAALLVFAGLAALVAMIVIAAVGPLWDQVIGLRQRDPEYWEDLTNSDAFQQIVSTGRRTASARPSRTWPRGCPTPPAPCSASPAACSGPCSRWSRSRSSSLFLLMERPTITDWLFGFAKPEVEQRWRPVLEDSISAISSSLIGNVAISLVAATVAGVSAWAFGLPFPIVLAVIVGFLDLIPQVGATIAGIILVLVALTVSTPAAIAMAVIQIIYQQVENYIVYPIVYRKAVSLSPFTTIVAVLIAGSILGVVGGDPRRPVRGRDQDRPARGRHTSAEPDGRPSARPSHRRAQSPSGRRRTSISSSPSDWTW